MRRFALVFAVLLFAPQEANALASSAAHAKGVNFFKHKQYNLAIYHLRTALVLEPKNALLHYYLANSLVHMRQHKEAINEYRLSYELDPFGTVSGFCRQALLTYNVAIPVVELRQIRKARPMYKEGTAFNKKWKEKEKAEDASAVSSDEETESDESSNEDQAHEPSVHEHHLNNASAMIRRQAADEKARKKMYVDNLSDNIVKTGQAKATKIRADAEEQIKEMYEGPTLYDSQGNARIRGVPAWRLSPMLQEYLKNRADQIRREADERAQLEISMSQDKSNEYKKWYMDREDDIDTVVDSLETQMLKPSKRSGISLSPVGTGLYVRNYQSFKPQFPIPEAHHSVVRILDRGFQDTEEGSSSTFKLPTERDMEVSGKVIK